MATQTATVARTADTLTDILLTVIVAHPGQEIGRVARHAGVDKGEAGRVLAWAESEGYVRVERIKGRRIYLPR